MQLDPAIDLALRCAFLALFTTSLLHKIVHFAAFRGTVATYVSGSLLAGRGATLAVTVAVLLGEAVAVIACVTPVTGTIRALLIAGILLVYAAAMALNLLRGNFLLDCGCTWGATRQPVGYELVVRNLVIALAALAWIAPASTRALHGVDFLTVLATVLMAALLYASTNRLLAGSAYLRGQA